MTRRVPEPVTLWPLPQRCPYCLGEARVESPPPGSLVVIRGCPCAANGTLRVAQGLAQRRWRELGVRGPTVDPTI
jgi:hypothetical protein